MTDQSGSAEKRIIEEAVEERPGSSAGARRLDPDIGNRRQIQTPEGDRTNRRPEKVYKIRPSIYLRLSPARTLELRIFRILLLVIAEENLGFSPVWISGQLISQRRFRA